MKFKSFTNRYEFAKDTLNRDFPGYLSLPINNWMQKVLLSARVLSSNDYRKRLYLKSEFLDELNVNFREVFPQYWIETAPFIFSDANRTADFIAICLQNFADSSDADELEHILSKGGSAFEVVPTKKEATEYDKGVYDLSERVSPIIKDQSSEAIDENELLQQAWSLCYSRNPDYEKVVIKCQDFLEHFLRDRYEPSNKKPQLGKIIGNLKAAPKKLGYKGDTVLNNKDTILLLIDNIATFRGIHTAGTGKVPTKEEAEYVLNTTIYTWNLHQK